MRRRCSFLYNCRTWRSVWPSCFRWSWVSCRFWTPSGRCPRSTQLLVWVCRVWGAGCRRSRRCWLCDRTRCGFCLWVASSDDPTCSLLVDFRPDWGRWSCWLLFRRGFANLWWTWLPCWRSWSGWRRSCSARWGCQPWSVSRTCFSNRCTAD